MLVVSYISYITLAKTAIRIFNCVDIFDELVPYSRTTHKFWKADTLVRCFQESHWVLSWTLGILLLSFSLLFPLSLAVFLIKTRIDGKLCSIEIQETVGLFYRGYEENFVFWDSIIMLRKAVLVTILVFAYSLGGTLQGLFALALLLLSLFLQTKLDPFKRDLGHLNELECASLFVSSFTFLSGLILNDPNLNSTVVEILIILTIFGANIGLTIVLFSFLFFALIDKMKFELLVEGIGSESMGRFFVIRVYFALQAQKILELVKNIIAKDQNAASTNSPMDSSLVAVVEAPASEP